MPQDIIVSEIKQEQSEVLGNHYEFLLRKLKSATEQLQELYVSMERIDQAFAIEVRSERGVVNQQKSLRYFAKQLWMARRRRNLALPDAIFGEPGWDMLLLLFSEEHDEHNLSINAACVAANVSLSTTIRWINILSDEGLVHRLHGGERSTSEYVALTDRGRQQITKCLRNALGLDDAMVIE